MPIIGAHVSAAGGHANAFANAARIGAEAIQIFGASPRQWAVTLPSPLQAEAFRAAWKQSEVKEVYLHAPYLINIADASATAREKSISALSSHLMIAKLLGANGLIFHIGSSKDLAREEAYDTIVSAMKKVLGSVPGDTRLIIENSAGGGNKIGSSPQEIGELIKRLASPRVRVCIDTAHTFEAGLIEKYTPENITTFFDECDAAFGTEKIVALHVNDSKTAFNSHHDRHENIGQGHIGIEGFRNLAKEKRIEKLPWLLEVPGFDDTGPDKKNIDLLKECCG